MPVQITHAQASKRTEPGRLYDTTRGLHLWVKSPKSKYWIFRTAVNGKRTDLSLGPFPSVGVADARKRAQELSDKVRAGEPISPSASESAGLAQARLPNFEEFAEHFVGTKSPEWRNLKHAEQWSSTLKTYAYPIIGKKELSAITTEDVLTILKPIWLTKTETATRLRGRLERVLAAATIKGFRSGVNPALWRSHLDCLLPMPRKLKKVKHHAALPYADMPEFMKDLHSRTGLAALALEFLILTGSRTGEVVNAKRNELQGDLWTIPGERMKSGREHRVPLPQRALTILGRAQEMDPSSEFVFSANGKPLSNMALLALLRRMSWGSITAHGFRSTLRDWVSEETNHPSEVAEMALAHVIPNKAESAYRRGDLLAKRKKLLEDWEVYCMNSRSTASIVFLRA